MQKAGILMFHTVPSQSSIFSNFSVGYSIPIIFSTLNFNLSNVLDLSNIQEQVKQLKIIVF